MLSRIYYSLQRRFWHLLNKRKFIKLGKKVVVKKTIFITPSYISLHDFVFINCNSRIEGVSQYEGVKFNPHIILNESCRIQQNLHLTCAELVSIGKGTAIGANVTITDIHHPYEDISIAIEKQPIKVFPVSIGENCKIYNNSVILPGTKIGLHCTIGANSVVSGKIPDYCVVVGAPAKIIKRYDFDTNAWRKTDKEGNFINNL